MKTKNVDTDLELSQLIQKAQEENLNPFDVYVGKMIKKRRKELKISQQQLAYVLGVTFQQIQKYEKGLNRISAEKLFEITQLLKTSFDFFFLGLEEFLHQFKMVSSAKKAFFEYQDNSILKEKNLLNQSVEETKNDLSLNPLFSKDKYSEYEDFYTATILEMQNNGEEPIIDDSDEMTPITKDEDSSQKIMDLYKQITDLSDIDVD